jgi:hypothetical protein
MTLLKDLIDIPTTSGADDFVVKLTDARARAAATLGDYVPTPAVVAKLNDALGRVDEAFRGRKSLATYLHGSFGSGKSHFMAVLTLLLEGAPEAFAKPALAPVVARNPWLGGRKVLVLGFHMLGARSIEERVLGDYLKQVRVKHPDAPTAPVYQSGALFDSATALRQQLGDVAFFAQLGGGDDDGWGDIGGAWDAARFDRAVEADESDPDRLALISTLLDKVPMFQAMREAFANSGNQYVPFDEGLRRLALHAQSLGYEAMVLCLDELILWLAQHATEQEFLNREIEKLVQLVEANAGDRAIPIVSFVARQRDLSELISTTLPNFAGSQIYAKLQHHEARFGSPIELPDSDLPAIAEQRLLAPRDAAARATIDAAFQRVTTITAAALQALGSEASQHDFRKVYPFTPAVVDVLVAASGLLQRDRTALKVMRELLVAHRETLELESVIPMGDLFDQLAVGQLAIDELFKIRFGRARRLWLERIAPALERKYGVHPDQARVAAASGDPKGRMCLGVGRIIKTLLLANVVEARRVLANLDIKRAVHLNHGSIRAPIPGGEAQQALAVLQELATEIPEIKITDSGSGGNPHVAIVPTEHDISSIVSGAAEFESQAAKVQALRRMCFGALGIDDASTDGQLRPIHECKIDWRRTPRTYGVLFANVSSLSSSELLNDDPSWKVIVDYPLPDTALAGATSDRERIAAFRAEGRSARTLIWTPRTFGEALQRDLGKLVRIEALLKSDQNFDRHTRNIPAADRESVRGLLRQQQSALQSRLNDALKSAYGLTACMDGVVDDVALDELFHSLDPALVPQMPAAATLGDAMRSVVERALASQFPGHPDFGSGSWFGRAALGKVLECCRRGVADAAQRMEPDQTERKYMWEIARPLGLARMTGQDSAAVLGTEIFEQLDRARLQRPDGEVKVGELRRALDEPIRRGLVRDMQDLVILLYADRMKLRMMRYGASVNDAQIGRLDDDVVLRQMPLPSEAHWAAAVQVMNTVFGCGLSTTMTVNAFGRFNNDVDRIRAERGGAVRELCEALVSAEAAPYCSREGSRWKTADVSRQLLDVMVPGDEIGRLVKIAGFTRERLQAMGRSIATSADVSRLLRATSWPVFAMIERLTGERAARAALILTRVRSVLATDEADAALAAALDGAVREANQLMLEQADGGIAAPPQGPTGPETGKPITAGSGTTGGTVRPPRTRSLRGAAAADTRASVDELLSELAQHPSARVNLTWEIVED